VRLAKFLAHAGVASRRASEQIVAAGRVSVAGVTVEDPARDVDGSEPVAVDGDPVRVHDGRRAVYAVNKPAGVVSTAHDPQGRPTVVELVPSGRRLYPVGRLDADTTGLILLTNDGPLAHRLTHPRFQVPKTYRAVVGNAPVRTPALRSLRQGIRLDDGPTAPAEARLIRPDTIELTIREGRKHQVRRMCEAVGHPVRSLERVRFGSLELGGLPRGRSRQLSQAEVGALAFAGSGPTAGSGARSRASGRPASR
jgi:23S rRNA pseudouridine2605 synthase